LGSDIGSLSLSNIGAGLKGMFGGQGYKLARQMNIVKNSVDKLDRMRDKLSNIMVHLRHVHVDLTELKTDDQYIQRMKSNLEGVVRHYENMRTAIDNLRNGVAKYYEQQEQLKQAKQKQKP
jgi:exonuclease VII small subunit